MKADMFLKNREVTRLCHFTKIKGLTHILASINGIEASSSIRPDVKNQIDSERYDGELEHVCCSIQFPNCWYLRQAVQRDQDQIFKGWVAIYIDLSILNHRSAKFCECNAAKNRGGYIFSNTNKLGDLYASPTALGRRRQDKLLSCCPTDDQAEVLIKDNIPYDFFTGIAVSNEDDADLVYSMLKTYSKSMIPIYLAPSILGTGWSDLVRRGIQPEEIELFSREEE